MEFLSHDIIDPAKLFVRNISDIISRKVNDFTWKNADVNQKLKFALVLKNLETTLKTSKFRVKIIEVVGSLKKEERSFGKWAKAHFS